MRFPGGSVASAVSLFKKNLLTGSPKKLEDRNDESSVLTILFVLNGLKFQFFHD